MGAGGSKRWDVPRGEPGVTLWVRCPRTEGAGCVLHAIRTENGDMRCEGRDRREHEKMPSYCCEGWKIVPRAELRSDSCVHDVRCACGELAWSLLAPCHFPATTSRAPSSIDAWGKRTEERSWMFVRWLI